MKEEFNEVIFEGLRKAKARELNIYTFALYHYHESQVVTVCIDKIESSSRSVRSSNEFIKQQFTKAIDEGDLQSVMSWISNADKSFSLGNFH
ncbi:hypothetical protein [Microbulbifer sp. TRSA005]|uniref:hypothetical protein n=1 Tax=Microbulbifer sp. TRSA005 TaxID=3243383 RepID=UPI00403A16D6